MVLALVAERARYFNVVEAPVLPRAGPPGAGRTKPMRSGRRAAREGGQSTLAAVGTSILPSPRGRHTARLAVSGFPGPPRCNHVLVSFWQIVVVLVFLAIMVAWVVALVDAVRRPQAQWEMAQQNKLLFVLLIIFLGWFGARCTRSSRGPSSRWPRREASPQASPDHPGAGSARLAARASRDGRGCHTSDPCGSQAYAGVDRPVREDRRAQGAPARGLTSCRAGRAWGR